MSITNPATVLREKLETHEDEIVKEWLGLVRLGHEEDWFSIHSKAESFLRKNLQEIRILLEKGDLKEIPRHDTPMPADGVLDGIHTLLVGEEVTAKILCKHQRNLDHWLLLRKTITRVFHRALRLNTTHACDACRHRLDESLIRGYYLKDSIKKMEGKHQDIP
jgi:hypothetical protein